MADSLVADLGIGPKGWLFLALISCVTLFFKFRRVWSVRNLDVVLLFVLGPAMVRLVNSGYPYPWWAFFWLFVGSTLWLIRCFLDLALTRRPVLEPNLTVGGLTCLGIAVLGLLLIETVSLPVDSGTKRNPAAPPRPDAEGTPPGSDQLTAPVKQALENSPLPEVLKRSSLQVILSRVLAVLSHLGIVAGLYVVGWQQFGQRIAGLAASTCYLLLPYTRIALVDSGQLVASALIVTAVAVAGRPLLAGLLIGLASCWMPACLGLVPLWAGYQRQDRRGSRFLLAAVGTVALAWVVGSLVPEVAYWSHALLARDLAEAGLRPLLEVAPPGNSFWGGIDPIFRLPVLIAYVALVAFLALWPAEKDLAALISQSTALLVASQYWFLDGGGTLIVLYLPLLLLMMFRPSLVALGQPRRVRPDSGERVVVTSAH